MISHSSTELTMLSTMAPRKAAAKPCTWNPGTTAAATSSMSALITNQNRPSVEQREREGDDLEQQSEGCVDEPDDQRCDQRRNRSAYADARHDVSNDPHGQSH